jgi:PEGA domain
MHIISKTKCMAFLLLLFFAAAANVSAQQGLTNDNSAEKAKLPDGKTGGLSGAPVHVQVERGALKVFSEPAGVTIIIDGTVVGTTPLKIINIDAGERTVALRREGFAAVDSGVRITANETQTLTFALKPVEAHAVEETPSTMPDTLTVTTVPPGAAIFINNQPAGTTPFRNEKLGPGNYRLRLELQGYAPMEGTVSLKPGESHAVEKKMVGLYGALSVTTAPSGATVTLNGHQLGATPFNEDKLLGGVYSLGLELPGYARISEDITIDKGSFVNRQYALSRSQAWLDSVAAFKRAKHKQWTRRLVFGLLAAGCGGVGAYYNQAAADAHADYSNLGPGSDFNAQWKKVEADRATRNVLYVVAGAFAAVFIISIPF